MQKEPEKEEHFLFNLRNFIFFIMVFAIGATLYFSSSRKAAPSEKLAALAEKTYDFQMKMMLAQVLTKPESMSVEAFLGQVEFLFENLEKSPLISKDKIDAQKFMALRFLGQNSQLPESVTGSLKEEIHLIYNRNRSPGPDAKVYKMPMGNLAKLHLLAAEGNQSEYNEMLEQMKSEAYSLLLKMQAVFFLILILFTSGIFILISFLKKKEKISHFIPAVELIPLKNRRLLIETFILHLFLMFPVASYISMVLPGLNLYVFNAAYIPFVFFLSLLYYWKNSSPDHFLKELILGIPEVNWIKEILFGIIGFIAIFPVAVLSLVMGLGIMDGPDVRFAHPVTFAIKDHLYLIFFLAVIVAPVTEEIIFRSFFYGFLRSYMRIHMAVIFNGFIFAVLHPQGMAAGLYLMVVGGGLAVLREFRQGLIAPITTHMLINLLATSAAYLIWQG
ncbi:MAG: CPBP family intramembrane metalloprotease [Spirochaetia bacterium]|nr:CPBP family intramembrane metalloprotease [Spirochaetia bacterium]